MSELVTISMTSSFSKDEILKNCAKGLKLLNTTEEGHMRIIEIVSCDCDIINAQGRRVVVIRGKVCE